MALPPDSEFRGVAAAIPQPASEEDALNQLSPYITGLTLYNNEGPRILYRNPDNDQDIIEAVYRWDTRPHQEIFETGFTPRPRRSTQSLASYYSLEQFVNGGGIPADTCPADGSVFVSTTRAARWYPPVTRNCTLYRYQIFAPGGIDAVLTLGNRNRYRNQQEISFAGGISRQYIRIVRPFSVTIQPGSRFPRYREERNRLIRNRWFEPNPTFRGWTNQEFMNRLRNPTCSGLINIYPAVEKRDAKDKPHEEESYVDPVCSVGHYIESAFNFTDTEEAYLFIADKCLLINYAPGTTDDKIIKGPLSIADAFPCLNDTIFASGIDAAFTACTNEAYIFRSNIYAHIRFTKDGGDIIWGPIRITDGFHSLKNTVFENGIDAAFASLRENQAYIFKGDQYALIDFAPYTPNNKIIQGPKKITLSFPSLKGTIFQDGFDAAFSYNKEGWFSTKTEAYIFKGNTYARIDYAPGTTNDKITNGPITPISNGFHSLKDIIPMYPCDC
ncbi:hypothetical protein SUGI_0090310, partial [Cryptomeria japonica]|uniref:uncharacterized protein LOC131876306 n=1 Tax=Cryptomeria japonica TaxID=3369 RepID=UPI002408CF72